MHNKKMKSCLLILAAFILLGSIPASAQSPDAKFSGPAYNFLGPKKKIEPTPAQIDESFAVYDTCKASDMIYKYYDCECLSARFLQLRTESPNAAQTDLTDKARSVCGNTVNIAGLAYQHCLSWAPRMRADYDRYCTCYANAYAKDFTKSPTDSIRGREVMMTSALNSCNDRSQIVENKARQNMVEQLKKEGLYDTLFPNAKTNPSQEPAQSPQ